MGDNVITGEGSPLEIANAHERAVQLGGPDFKLPDGRTVAETRAAILEEHTKEGEATNATQLARVREQSIENDPIYAKGGTVVANAAGGATVVEATPEAEKVQTTQRQDRFIAHLPDPSSGD